MTLQISVYLIVGRFNENLLAHSVAKLFRLSAPISLHLISSLDLLLFVDSKVVVVELMFCLNKSWHVIVLINFQQHVSVESF